MINLCKTKIRSLTRETSSLTTNYLISNPPLIKIWLIISDNSVFQQQIVENFHFFSPRHFIKHLECIRQLTNKLSNLKGVGGGVAATFSACIEAKSLPPSLPRLTLRDKKFNHVANNMPSHAFQWPSSRCPHAYVCLKPGIWHYFQSNSSIPSFSKDF